MNTSVQLRTQWLQMTEYPNQTRLSKAGYLTLPYKVKHLLILILILDEKHLFILEIKATSQGLVQAKHIQ